MANPRAFTGYEGIGAENITCYADDFGVGTATIVYDETEDGGSAQVGLAVTPVAVSAGKTEIDLVGDAGAVLGKLLRVEPDGACTVQVAGGMTLPGGDAATLTIGTKIVGDLGAAGALGYVRSVAAATLAEVAVASGKILDPSTTTAVQVWL